MDATSRPVWIEAPVHKANRLLGYEVVDTTETDPPLRVKYDYALFGHAAGNVAQIGHLIITDEDIDGDTTVTTYAASGPVMEHNKMGGLWVWILPEQEAFALLTLGLAE